MYRVEWIFGTTKCNTNFDNTSVTFHEEIRLDCGDERRKRLFGLNILLFGAIFLCTKSTMIITYVTKKANFSPFYEEISKFFYREKSRHKATTIQF